MLYRSSFTTDTDYRITRYQVGAAADPGAIIDRSLILDRRHRHRHRRQQEPYARICLAAQSFAYTPTRRLAMARGSYGVLGWSYDANGNRLTETTNNVISTYVYPTNSNRLAAVTTPGGRRGPSPMTPLATLSPTAAAARWGWSSAMIRRDGWSGSSCPTGRPRPSIATTRSII